MDADRVVMGWQVHGTDLREWDGRIRKRAYADPGDKELPRVDGHLTRQSELALLVLVADCYPVALSNGEQVAMLHCGWRPLAGGIVERAVAEFETPPCRRRRPRDRGLLLRGRDRGGRAVRRRGRGARGPHARPARVIAARLAGAGVRDVSHLDRCTSCEPELYFSHRRDHGVTGRQAGLCVLNR